MKFHIITLFPNLFDSYFSDSLLKRGKEKKLISFHFLNPRDFCEDKHRRVDDIPYGGGPGMVLKALPILRAWEEAKKNTFFEKVFRQKKRIHTIIFSPEGKKLDNDYAQFLVDHYDELILINGRYEGIDERVAHITKAEKISIGNYILTGGELASMVLIDVVSRRIPGFLGKEKSLEEKRIASHQVYTRPRCFSFNGEDYCVPQILLEGNHKKIEEWRKERA